MKFIHKDIDLIEAYLSGKLDDQQLKAVEVRLSIDPDFQELVNEIGTLMKGIKREGRESMLRDLKKLDQTLPNISTLTKEKKYGHKIIRGYWKYAAAAVLIIAFLLNLNPVIPKEYLNPYSPNNFRSSNNSEVTSIYTEPGYSSYLAKDYKAAARELESIQAKNDTVWFYLGNTYFALRLYSKALICFEDESLGDNTLYSDDAKWYMALCLITTRQFQKAKPQLEDLALRNTLYTKKAEKLLEKRRFK